jgi:hypothetical protein
MSELKDVILKFNVRCKGHIQSKKLACFVNEWLKRCHSEIQGEELKIIFRPKKLCCFVKKASKRPFGPLGP